MAKRVNVVNELKNETVRIKALEGAKYMTEGKVYSVHPTVGERLVAKKQAVKVEN